jgi:hypothetical protein
MILHKDILNIIWLDKLTGSAWLTGPKQHDENEYETPSFIHSSEKYFPIPFCKTETAV